VVRIIICLAGILFSGHAFSLTQVTASVDKNPVVANESFIFTVVADDDIDTNALDTSSLMKNFIVGRTSVSSQTSMVNFNTSRTTTWTTVLIPRQAGKFIIPALSIDNLQTNPITLDVIQASDLPASAQQNLFITSDISAKSVYVQQQVTLNVKLHFAAELKRGSLTEPTLADANIIQIGKDKESENIINGKRYRVIERIYAISPQKSGLFTLKSPVFSGEIMMPSSRRSNFLSFAETKPISVIGEDIELEVKAIPSSVQGTWLPSELLAVHQEWQPEPSTFKVGEPITRTITLTAAGLSEEQLPEITMTMPAGLKVYPDQAELHTGLNNGRLVSQKVGNFAIVASRAGEFILPEITIPWWNTVTNKYQTASIASQTITILPNADIPTFNAQQPTVSQQDGTASASETKTLIVSESSPLQWLFLALWLLTILAWYLHVRAMGSKQQKRQPDNVNNAYLALLAACKKDDGEQALSLLLPWAKSYHLQLSSTPSLNTMDSLNRHFNDNEFSAALLELQQCYFGKQPEPWQGKNLLKVIQKLHKKNDDNKTSPSWSLNP
jgi:hypothetical protein